MSKIQLNAEMGVFLIWNGINFGTDKIWSHLCGIKTTEKAENINNHKDTIPAKIFFFSENNLTSGCVPCKRGIFILKGDRDGFHLGFDVIMILFNLFLFFQLKQRPARYIQIPIGARISKNILTRF